MTITARIDAITGIADAYRSDELPAPKSVKIELTGRCNFACSFCARSMRLRDQKDMDRALFERLLPEMRAAGVEEIGLFYLGESFMVDWLEDAIRFAKHEVGFPYVFLTTNGSLANPDRVEACMAAGLDSLKFSLNYADADQFRSIARVKKALYKALLDNIKAAKARRDGGGYKTGLYASYIMYDGEQGERMQAVVEDVRPFLDEVYALPLYNQAAFIEGQNWEFTAGNRGRYDNLRDPLPCWAVFTEGHITWDGKLSACCFDHDGRFHMGDLVTTGFMDSWNSDRFRKLRRAHLARDVKGTVCEACVAYN
ncbi:MAG: radical SAM protein [Rhodobacteraceae bacterium]|nr:radical SAM protein [Paracoccaceae bacterium]